MKDIEITLIGFLDVENIENHWENLEYNYSLFPPYSGHRVPSAWSHAYEYFFEVWVSLLHVPFAQCSQETVPLSSFHTFDARAYSTTGTLLLEFQSAFLIFIVTFGVRYEWLLSLHHRHVATFLPFEYNYSYYWRA